MKERTGASDEEIRDVLHDVEQQYKEWGKNEKTRVLSDGTVTFNPEANVLNRDSYREMVENSGGARSITS